MSVLKALLFKTLGLLYKLLLLQNELSMLLLMPKHIHTKLMLLPTFLLHLGLVFPQY